jgi:hypothetical protein
VNKVDGKLNKCTHNSRRSRGLLAAIDILGGVVGGSGECDERVSRDLDHETFTSQPFCLEIFSGESETRGFRYDIAWETEGDR